MRSQLTRSVFRHLLSNEPLSFNCPHATTARRGRLRQIPVSHNASFARRSIFGFANKPTAQVRRRSDITPGLAEIAELNKALYLNRRPATPAEVADALCTFINSKKKHHATTTELEWRQIAGAFSYLCDNRGEGGTIYLDRDDLCTMLQCLAKVHGDGSEVQSKLLDAVWRETSPLLPPASITSEVVAYCKAVSRLGRTEEGALLLNDLGPETAREVNHTYTSLWKILAVGYLAEDNEAGLHNALEHLNNDNKLSKLLPLKLYAKRNDVEATKRCFTELTSNLDSSLSAEAFQIVLDFSGRNGEQEWCNAVFGQLIDSWTPRLSKGHWDVLILWAARNMGKSVEDLEHMMSVVDGLKHSGEPIKLDIKTINLLVDHATKKQDPYLAERYIALGLKRGIHPDAKTWMLQLEYRTAIGDLSGAYQAYNSLQSEEILEGEDAPILNTYLRALCQSVGPTIDRVTLIVTNFAERNLHLEIDSVIEVAKVYIANARFDDVVIMLQAHISEFDSPQRARAIPVFVQHILDPKTTAENAWSSYNILRSFFSEVDLPTRTTLMASFFERKRSDMAVHIFGHCRAHDLANYRPNIDTYITALEGIADCVESEQLRVLHNMLKLDVNIEPSTRLNNALMLAYTAVARPERAFQFWDDITNSEEGPTYESLEIVFWTCGKRTGGDEDADKIWTQLHKLEVDITKRVYAQYLGCLAGNARLSDVSRYIHALNEGALGRCAFGLDRYM